MDTFLVLILVLLTFMGSGCATPKKVDTARVASHPDQVVEKPHHGSLWNPRHPQNFLFVDVKAKRVNDIVTVQIVESSSGSKSASTATGRSSTISTDVTALFGLPVNTLFGGGSFNNLSVDAEASAEFDGEGSTQRSGRLTASISTKVKEVLPNGNFFIEGTREIVVNREKQFITLTGVIRPEDILPNNTILSTYVSEAKIKYSGRGVIQDNQGPGWLFRILNWLWPF